MTVARTIGEELMDTLRARLAHFNFNEDHLKNLRITVGFHEKTRRIRAVYVQPEYEFEGTAAAPIDNGSHP